MDDECDGSTVLSTAVGIGERLPRVGCAQTVFTLNTRQKSPKVIKLEKNSCSNITRTGISPESL
jgi:hypothetical protein